MQSLNWQKYITFFLVLLLLGQFMIEVLYPNHLPPDTPQDHVLVNGSTSSVVAISGSYSGTTSVSPGIMLNTSWPPVEQFFPSIKIDIHGNSNYEIPSGYVIIRTGNNKKG